MSRPTVSRHRGWKCSSPNTRRCASSILPTGAADLGGRRNAGHRRAQLHRVPRRPLGAVPLRRRRPQRELQRRRAAGARAAGSAAPPRLSVYRLGRRLRRRVADGLAASRAHRSRRRARARAARDRDPGGRRCRAGAGRASPPLHPLHEPARGVFLGRRVDARRDPGPQPAPQLARAPAVDGRGAARAAVSVRPRALERPRPHAGPDVRLDRSRDVGAAVCGVDVRRQPRVRHPGSAQLRECPALAADLHRAVSGAALSRHARVDVLLGGRSRAAVARPDPRHLLRGTRDSVDRSLGSCPERAPSGRALWFAAVLSAAVPAAGLFWLTQVVFPNGVELHAGYVGTAFPLVLSFILLGTLVFIGTAGPDFDVADLEWWSRFGAWVLIAATAWFVASAVVFGGPVAFSWTRDVVARLVESALGACLRRDRAPGSGARRARRVAGTPFRRARKPPGGPPDSARALGPRLRRRAARHAVVGRRAAGARAVAVAGPGGGPVRHGRLRPGE